MADGEKVERVARALWENWGKCKSAAQVYRVVSFDDVKRWSGENQLMAEMLEDAYSQARVAIDEALR